ncbi:DUF2254 family protein [Deinococcus planocerae]|uniref:DUF2254 family protein n=1 Tax=Deinococcus planocerae TaxID=1737569 RepID=UPI0011AF82C4
MVLSLTSSQRGPRLLQHFMRHRSQLVALGTFIVHVAVSSARSRPARATRRRERGRPGAAGRLPAGP